MAKIGDTVRYLNAVGGGKITRIEGRMAYVDDQGFETPVLLSEVVVVMPAGHQPAQKGASLMFDQQAFDDGRSKTAGSPAPQPEALPEPELPIEETSHGEKISIALAFEPLDIKRISESGFNAVLVNDSNFFLDFAFLRRAGEERGWSVVYRGTVAPNELIDLAQYSHQEVKKLERVALQAVAYKRDKEFTLQEPINVRKRIDVTKFHKLHCFRPGIYFDSPVLEISLLKEGVAPASPEEERAAAERLAQKFRVEADGKAKKTKKSGNPADNPNKLLPPIEVDLHISELLDTTAGMSPADILNFQLETVGKVMKANSRRIGQKIIFIHGKGEGVLRKAVLALLRKQYPKADLQDASFQEYGFGATLVTIH